MIYPLVCHSDTPTVGIAHVSVQLGRATGSPNEIVVEYHVHSDGGLSIPEPKAPRRADGLWRTTCFELFLRPPEQDGYVEFNLSPSFEWAAYSFDAYRTGMTPIALGCEPEIEITPTDGRHFWLWAELDVSEVASGSAQLGLSAVIEEIDGTKSYWALAHAPGPPDFHNPACFTATLPPPPAP